MRPPTDIAGNPLPLDEPGLGALLAGRYRLGELVGRGGMADVYAAQDELLARPVAVKIFRADNPTASDRRRVTAEVQTLASLRHPGLVTVFDAGTGEPPLRHPFLVMELITGPTLAQHLAGQPMAPDAVRRLATDLASALAYVHARGIVHRDVKPANILLDNGHPAAGGHQAKLGDFGIARLVDSARLTTDGTTLGTANYLSPEQVTGGEVSTASDIYSLGLVLIECLSGKLAYPGSGVEAALARLHAQPVVPTRFGGGWSRMLTAMTERDPAGRPTAPDVLDRLSALDQSSPTSAPTVVDRPTQPLDQVVDATTVGPPLSLGPGRTPTSGHPRRVAIWTLAAAAIVVATVLLVAVTAFRPHQPSGQNPAPAYPAVPGQVGQDLGRLQRAVG